MNNVNNIIDEIDDTKSKCYNCKQYFKTDMMIWLQDIDKSRSFACVECYDRLVEDVGDKYANRVKNIIDELDPNKMKCRICKRYYDPKKEGQIDIINSRKTFRCGKCGENLSKVRR